MKKISLRKFEHMILPRFRQEINEAESTEHIKKAFVSSIIDFFETSFGGCHVRYEDVEFKPYEEPYFCLGNIYKDQGMFKEALVLTSAIPTGLTLG